MSSYLLALLCAFINPLFHAWSNIIDGYFSNNLFKRIPTLVWFSVLSALLFLPIVIVLDPPKLVSFSVLGILVLIALIEVLYQYPYYYAFRHADTSIVASLFSLGKIFAPLFAFFLVREHLTTLQYLGFFIVIVSGAFLTLDLKKLKFNQAFFLMLGVSSLLSLQSVLYKYVFEQGTSWGTAVTWTTLLGVGIATLTLIPKQNRQDLADTTGKLAKIAPLFLFVQFLTWGGEMASTFALSVIPVSVEKAITSTQPLFVLIYAIVFVRLWPHLFKEYLGKGEVVKKAVAFVCILIGVILVASP